MHVKIVMNFSSESEVNQYGSNQSRDIFSMDSCNIVIPREYQQLKFYWLP